MTKGDSLARIALGTVQFGLNYGVANRGGQVSLAEAVLIVDSALSFGIDTLDTAIAYGESEQRLGEIGVAAWKIISKLPPVPEGVTHIHEWIQGELAGSIKRLNIPCLYGLLLHRSQELCGPQGEIIYDALIELKKRGKVKKIGVSIYSPDELDVLWPKYRFDLVQAPLNVIDRRLVTSGWLKRLYLSGVEVHTRSAFLQGLLLMAPIERPAAFSHWQPLWEKWHAWLTENTLTPLQACLAFVLSHQEISRIVIGVDSVRQLKEIMSSISITDVTPPMSLMSNDENLINPSVWSLS